MIDKRLIRAIENGIVIDHLPAGVAWKVAEILDLIEKREGKISLGDNHRSDKITGLKSFIKIEGRVLSQYEMDLIALVAPNATINIIRDGEVFEKKNANLPEVLRGVVKCPNFNCISNKESEGIRTKIYCKDSIFTCHYCRQAFSRRDFKI